MRRNLFDKLLHHIVKKEFTIITGARQTGKSTLMKQLEAHCQDAQMPVAFLNLENKNILLDLNRSPLNLFSYIPESNERVMVFIDEVQYLDDPSNFLKLLYDDYWQKIKIIATGSSAFYIDSSFKDSLAGRKKIFNLPTCSFDEYLLLRNRPDLRDDVRRIQSNEKAKSIYIDILQQEWEDYMLYGGYPAVITEPDKQEKVARLAEIRDSYIKRDVLESGVQNETAFYNLFRILATQSGNLLNTNELSLSLRIKNDTVNSYLTILQKCFHIVLVKPFYRNLRKELMKMPKSYLLDTGLLNSLLNNFQPLALRTDKGMLWENTCFRLLYDQYGSDEIFFWRTSDNNEVDFVLPRLEKPFAIEAKFDETAIKPSKYKKFVENYSDIPLSYSWQNPFGEDFFRRIIN
jgi:predicted AAA+ superfamily ATPase